MDRRPLLTEEPEELKRSIYENNRLIDRSMEMTPNYSKIIFSF